jgi:hypothetical protein
MGKSTKYLRSNTELCPLQVFAIIFGASRSRSVKELLTQVALKRACQSIQAEFSGTLMSGFLIRAR